MKTYEIDVWGDLACFSPPEAKVERFSYPIMTLSAARGVLDAIYSKNIEFYWQVEEIWLMKPIQYISLMRNEVKNFVSDAAVKKAIKGADFEPIVVDATRDTYGSDQVGRTQRQTLALKDVRYRILAHITPRPNFKDKRKSLEEQFERRLNSGKCFYQPYLGCREFVCYFEPAQPEGNPVAYSEDLGYMVYDIFDLSVINNGYAKSSVSLFKAEIVNGVMRVPDWNSSEVKK